MRDSQSLLEQLLAVGGRRITVEDVNNLLGTASDERLSRLAGHLVARDAAAAIVDLDAAAAQGVDTGQLLDQLLVYFRDLMVAAVGSSADVLLQTDPAAQAIVAEQAQQLGLQTVLAAMQVLDHTIARLRFSTQGRVLAELALVRICQLADLEELPALIEQIKTGAPFSTSARAVTSHAAGSRPVAASPVERAPVAPAIDRGSPPAPDGGGASKKNDEADLISSALVDEGTSQSLPLQVSDGPRLWQQTLARLQGMAADYASQSDHVAISAQTCWS